VPVQGAGTVFIDPRSPWQNAWIESCNGRMRDEFLNGTQFDSRLEAQVLTEAWRSDDHHPRPTRPTTGSPRSRSSNAGSTDSSYSSHSEWLIMWGPLTCGIRGAGLIDGAGQLGVVAGASSCAAEYWRSA
jgi:putative transposase